MQALRTPSTRPVVDEATRQGRGPILLEPVMLARIRKLGHNGCMRRLSKMLSDSNQTAALTVELVNEEPEAASAAESAVSRYLATIGRKGGIKGGKARAKTLTSEQRSDIARLAAKTRWAAKEP